ncbi:MAG: hypothetical protein RR419_01415 [Akkermansia sp.]
MAIVSNKWKKKEDDSKAGLAFDWRFMLPSGVKLVYLMVPLALVVIVFLAVFNVRSDQSISNKGRQSGTVFYLENDANLRALLSRSLPMSSKGPVWADPTSLGVDRDVFSLIHAGLGESPSPLKLMAPSPPLGEMSHLTGELILPVPDTQRYESPMVKIHRRLVPMAVLTGDSLAEYDEGEALIDVEGRPDFGGSQTSFWIVADSWGKPRSVVILESSGDDALDQKAREYVKALRWLPSQGNRAGQMIVGWQEVTQS